MKEMEAVAGRVFVLPWLANLIAVVSLFFPYFNPCGNQD